MFSKFTPITPFVFIAGALFIVAAIIDAKQNKVAPVAVTAQPSVTPLSLIAIKDCGKLLGVLVIRTDGVIENVPGPFNDDARAAIKAMAQAIGDSKKLATIDMPCHVPSDGGREGETTANVL